MGDIASNGFITINSGYATGASTGETSAVSFVNSAAILAGDLNFTLCTNPAIIAATQAAQRIESAVFARHLFIAIGALPAVIAGAAFTSAI
jgi:hypothetical protein